MESVGKQGIHIFEQDENIDILGRAEAAKICQIQLAGSSADQHEMVGKVPEVFPENLQSPYHIKASIIF